MKLRCREGHGLLRVTVLMGIEPRAWQPWQVRVGSQVSSLPASSCCYIPAERMDMTLSLGRVTGSSGNLARGPPGSPTTHTVHTWF